MSQIYRKKKKKYQVLECINGLFYFYYLYLEFRFSTVGGASAIVESISNDLDLNADFNIL